MKKLGTTSCSDCRMQHCQKLWRGVLMRWYKQCISPNSDIVTLNSEIIAEIITKYKDEICHDTIDRATLQDDNIDAFLKYKFPILRLDNIDDEKEADRKLYVKITTLLFYCCMNSKNGRVDDDICNKLTRSDQDLILNYCENLCENEVTVSNLDRSVQEACSRQRKSPTLLQHSFSDELKKMQSTAKFHQKPSSKFKSSVMVLPSSIVNSSPSYSTDNKSESDVDSSGKNVHCDYDDSVVVYKLGSNKLEKLEETCSWSESFTRHDCDCSSCPPDSCCDHPEACQCDSASESDKSSMKSGKSRKSDKKHQDDNKNRIWGHFLNMSQNQNFKGSKEMKDGDHGKNSSKSKRSDKKKRDDENKGKGEKGKDELDKKKAKKEKKNKDKSKDAGKQRRQCCSPKARRIIKKWWWKWLLILLGLLLLLLLIVLLVYHRKRHNASTVHAKGRKLIYAVHDDNFMVWHCTNGVCERLRLNNVTALLPGLHYSRSRCILKCSGPEIWPHPNGQVSFGKGVVGLTTRKLEYKLHAVTSEKLSQHLSEAFKNFLSYLIDIERVDGRRRYIDNDFVMNKLNIHISVESDPDPRMRMDTDESYSLKIESRDGQVLVRLTSASFVGVRHALETLSQLIIIDEYTGSLITVNSASIKESPSFRYRGLMLDTARNFVPVNDVMRTIDAMAACKMNTFHWRVSDVTSFSLEVDKLPMLTEFGAYDRSMIYSERDVELVAKRAGFKGIRVVIEVAAPGPVGRPWSWSPEASCPTRNPNATCSDILCLRLNMVGQVFDYLQTIYTEIISMTKVEDIFHLSDSLFALSNCYNLIADRQLFLERALERLRLANKGTLPRMPIIWYTKHMNQESSIKTWEKLGVQITEWHQSWAFSFLGRYRAIHSSKWDLSCETKNGRCKKYTTWQEMYNWRSWKSLDVYSVEGGEALAWTDLIESHGLDSLLWPRVAAVAERLWADATINSSTSPTVYLRMDRLVRRLVRVGVKARPVWPTRCSFNPGQCLAKINI